jgi:hypothetical protein
MAGKHDYEATTQRTFERFAEIARKAFTEIANAWRPVFEAVAEVFRKFKANRRIRRAVHLRHLTQAAWYMSDHQRRLAARKPIWQEFAEVVSTADETVLSGLPTDGAERHDDYIRAGVAGVAETAEGGRT